VLHLARVVTVIGQIKAGLTFIKRFNIVPRNVGANQYLLEHQGVEGILLQFNQGGLVTEPVAMLF
jgi:hypothetical protein